MNMRQPYYHDRRIYCGKASCRGGHTYMVGQWRLDNIDCSKGGKHDINKATSHMVSAAADPGMG